MQSRPLFTVHLLKPRLEKVTSFVRPGRKTYGRFKEQSNDTSCPRPSSMQLLNATCAMVGQSAEPQQKKS